MTPLPNNPDSLETRLRQPPSRTELPVNLHDSIMSTVRSAPRESTSQRRLSLVRLAIIILAVGALWWMAHPRARGLPPMAATILVEKTHELAREAPGVMLSPLSQEMEALSQDFTNSTRFVRASVPWVQLF